MNAWVYIKSEPNLWTVGFYSPDGNFHTDSDWGIRDDARRRVHYLNGGTESEAPYAGTMESNK